MQTRWIRLLLAAGVVALDLIIGGWVSWWHLLCWPTLLMVITVTITEDLWYGLGFAVVSGAILDVLSIVPSHVHLVGMIAASLGAWIFSRRIVTSRSTISFLSAISVGTAAYALGAVALDSLASLIEHDRYHLVLQATLVATIGQMIIHPLLISILWRILGRGRYERLTSPLQQTF